MSLGTVGLSGIRRFVRRAANQVLGRTFGALPAGSLPAGATRPSAKLFIVGCPRSGTSWIAEIFACHPRVLISRESHLFERVFEPIRRHPAGGSSLRRQLLEDFDTRADENPVIGVHRYVERDVFARILDECIPVEDRIPVDRRRVAEDVVRRILEAFHSFNGGDESRLLAEKTPRHVLYGEQILRMFPEARLLHVVRDGRDVCTSLQIRSRAASWCYQQREDQVLLWKQCVRAGLRLAEQPQFQQRVAVVRYEDMKRSPCDEIERLYRFAGLVAGRRQAARVARRTDFSRQKQVGPGRHNRKGTVGDWKNYFGPDENERFRQLAGAEFEACGYTFDRD